MRNSEEYLADVYKKLGDFRNDFRNYNLVHLIASKVRKGDAVLDIGCGSGFLLEVLRKQGCSVFGIEPNEEIIQLAKELNSELEIYRGNAENLLEVVSRKFQAITMIDVLEHIEDDRRQIQLTHSCLEDGGLFYIVVPAFRFLYGKRDKNAGHYRRYSRKELVQLLTENGFDIVDMRYWNALGFFPYLFSEKVLKKELNTKLRTASQKNFFENIAQKILHMWFRNVENILSFGFGLSLVCIARKR